MDLGPHAVFIVMAYAVTGLIVAGLIVRAALDHRAQTRALASLESRGARRRSDVRRRAPGQAPAPKRQVDGAMQDRAHPETASPPAPARGEGRAPASSSFFPAWFSRRWRRCS